MPAAITKAETNKINNSNEVSSDLPIRQAIIIIEHKIRNLEKRKTKLESYRAIQFSGKELSQDQKTAVAKYNEVAQSLELARDFVKQLSQLSSNYEKEVKKQLRKDAILRAQQETSKIREVLILQDTLKIFKRKDIWNDFVEGTNGAIQLTEKEINVLKKFVTDVEICNNGENNNLDGQKDNLHKVAEYLSLTIDGRSKIYFDEFTFEHIKDLLKKVRSTSFNEPQTNPLLPSNGNENTGTEELNPSSDTVENNDISLQKTSQGESDFKSEAPSATILPTPTFGNMTSATVTIDNNMERIYLEQTDSLNPMFTAIPINNDHESTFNEQQKCPIVQIRPLSEVIGCGNFFFIQESEIDNHEQVDQDKLKNEENNTAEKSNQMKAIHSQTFTNQSMILNDSPICPVDSSQSISTNQVENFNNQQTSCTPAFVNVDPPNASNLPMPGFPALGKAKQENKIDVGGGNPDDWKQPQLMEYEQNKWSASNSENKNNRQFSRANINNDRNGQNIPRNQNFKQNGLRGSGHNYFKSNDAYYQQGIVSNNFRSRNSRDKGNDRGNTYTARSQK